jgi:hypothetical protein
LWPSLQLQSLADIPLRLAVDFGVLAFFWPGLTLITLIWLWGAYALSDGPIAYRPHSTRPAAIRSALVAGAERRRQHHRRRRALFVHRRQGSHHRCNTNLRCHRAAEGAAPRMAAHPQGALPIAFGVILTVQPGAGALAVGCTTAYSAVSTSHVVLGREFSRAAQASGHPTRWVRIGWSGRQLSDCSSSAPPEFIGR